MAKFKNQIGENNRDAIYKIFDAWQKLLNLNYDIKYIRRYSEPRKNGYTCKWYGLTRETKRGRRFTNLTKEELALFTKLAASIEGYTAKISAPDADNKYSGRLGSLRLTVKCK